MTKQETNLEAGILVYQSSSRPEILLAHPGGPLWSRSDQGSWSIPKGPVCSDEVLSCAQRHFTNDTGLIADGEFISLRPIEQKRGKLLTAFAVESKLDLAKVHSNMFSLEWPPGSGCLGTFPEIDRI